MTVAQAPPQLFDVVLEPPYLRIVAVGKVSERQFRAAMEGRCPGCDSTDLERVESENSEWMWATCSDCCWSDAFRAVARKNRIVWRMLPATPRRPSKTDRSV